MSIDNTVNELSNTLSELGRLVNHINSQISGITGRINQTLDNFDDSVAKVAGDASSVTGQITDTVSQVPNSWVFYLLLITLCIVFILLSVVLSLNLVTKMHAIYVIFKGREAEKEPILGESYDELPTKRGPSPRGVFRARPSHVALPIDVEQHPPPPRRFGGAFDPGRAPGPSENGFPEPSPPVIVQRRIGDSSHTTTPQHLAAGPGPPPRAGIYHLDSGATTFATRSLKSQEV